MAAELILKMLYRTRVYKYLCNVGDVAATELIMKNSDQEAAEKVALNSLCARPSYRIHHVPLNHHILH